VTGFLQQFPDPAPLLRLQGDAEVGVNGLLDVMGSIGPESQTSPLATAVGALDRLRTVIDVDVSGLSTGLPGALDVLRGALPASALEYVEGIETAYAAAQDFLVDSPLVTHIAQGSSLQDTALAVIDDALTRFESGLTELAGSIVDPDIVELVEGAFADIERFRTDYAGNTADFPLFLARNLLGVAPDVLGAPLQHVRASLAVLAPLDPDALGQALDPARAAMGAAAAGLPAAVESLDPGSAEGYAAIQARLDDLEAAIRAVSSALADVYGDLGALVDDQPWDGVFATLGTLLGAVDVGSVPTVDDVIGAISGVLEELLGRLFVVLDADDLGARVGLLVQTLDDTVATSGLGLARDAVRDFLDGIRQAIEDVPTEELGTAVEAMLARVHEELDDLGIDTVAASIEAAFTRIDTFVAEVFTTTLVDDAAAALRDVLDPLGSLPIDALAEQLDAAITQMGDLVGEIATALQNPMEDVAAFAAQLDTLSFRPVADDVIKEIDEIKGRLEEIDPNVLSDVERLGLQAALAVLRSIDLEGQVITGLKQGFAAAQRGVTDLLAELGRVLDRVRAHVDQFSPDKALKPLDGLLGQAAAQVQRLNATVLLRPLYETVDDLADRLDQVSPGRLLAPLQAPYDALMSAVGRIDPAQWVAPLRTLYAEIDRLIGLVDVTPLLEELDRRRKDLLTHVRSTLIDALTALDLPEPLDGLLDAVRPILEGITDALVGRDLGTEMPRLSEQLRAGLDLGAPLALLDAPFDRLVGMLDAVPEDAVVETLEALRTSVGAGLDALDPRAVVGRFHEGQGRLAALAAPVVLATPLGLPGLRAAFDVKVQAAPPERADDVAAVRARFEATFALVDPDVSDSVTDRLTQAHGVLAARLADGIGALDVAGVGKFYARVRADLDRLVPDFLRAPEPLTQEQVRAGLATLRPSTKAAPMEALVRRFLVRAEPLQAAISEAVDALFGALGRLLTLVDPLSLRDAVAAIYQAVRDKVRIIDPDALAQELRDDLLTPLLEPLRAIDPSAIRSRLDRTFTQAVAALRNGVTAILDALAEVVDERLAALRVAVEKVIGTLRTSLQVAGQQLQGVLQDVEQLVLVELLGRLDRLVANLGSSFDTELDRVRSAFDDMLAALPLQGGGDRAASAVGA
jgi:hypothetical protein